MMTPSTDLFEVFFSAAYVWLMKLLYRAISGGSSTLAVNTDEAQASIGKDTEADVEKSRTVNIVGDMVTVPGRVSAITEKSLEQESHSHDQLFSAPRIGNDDTKRVQFTEVLFNRQDSSTASDNQDHVTSSAETHRAATDGNLADGKTCKSSVPQETYFAAFPSGKFPHPSPYVSYGLPFNQACAMHIAETIHATQVFILVCDSLSKNTDDLPRLHAAINDRCGEDTVVGIHRRIRPNAFYSDILKIVKEVMYTNAKCFVTLGGGSLADAAKIAALAVANEATTFADLESLCFDSPTLRNPVLPATMPIICIPTSLSVREYTPIAGATNDTTQQKRSFQHVSISPRLIILDPVLTATTPLHIWLSTGVRAIDHCVESICSIQSSTEGNLTAAQGLRRLVPGLLRTKLDPAAIEPRLECQLGALDAITAPLGRVPMGASHGIGHQLSPLGRGVRRGETSPASLPAVSKFSKIVNGGDQLDPLGLWHGETSCVLLPAVCKFNKSVNEEQQRVVMNTLWGMEIVSKGGEMDGIWKEWMDLGDMLDALLIELGMPRSLRQVGVGKEKWDVLANQSLNDLWCKTNPVQLTEESQVKQILALCA